MISIHRSKEEIADNSLGFQVHDKQIRTLCGPISTQEEQLFGYEVTVYRKWNKQEQKIVFRDPKRRKWREQFNKERKKIFLSSSVRAK